MGVGLRVADGDGVGGALLGRQYGAVVELLCLLLHLLLLHLPAALFVGFAFALRPRSEGTSAAELREECSKGAVRLSLLCVVGVILLFGIWRCFGGLSRGGVVCGVLCRFGRGLGRRLLGRLCFGLGRRFGCSGGCSGGLCCCYLGLFLASAFLGRGLFVDLCGVRCCGFGGRRHLHDKLLLRRLSHGLSRGLGGSFGGLRSCYLGFLFASAFLGRGFFVSLSRSLGCLFGIGAASAAWLYGLLSIFGGLVYGLLIQDVVHQFLALLEVDFFNAKVFGCLTQFGVRHVLKICNIVHILCVEDGSHEGVWRRHCRRIGVSPGACAA